MNNEYDADERPRSTSRTGSVTEEEWRGVLLSLADMRGEKFNIDALLRDCPTKKIYFGHGNMVLYFNHNRFMEAFKTECNNEEIFDTIIDAVSRNIDNIYKLAWVCGEPPIGDGCQGAEQRD